MSLLNDGIPQEPFDLDAELGALKDPDPATFEADFRAVVDRVTGKDSPMDFKSRLKKDFGEYDRLQKKAEQRENDENGEEDITLFNLKFAAVEKLLEIRRYLQESVDESDRKHNEVLLDVLKGVIDLQLGTIKLELDMLDVDKYNSAVEKLGRLKGGEEYLEEALAALEKHEIQALTVVPAINALHEMCSYWSLHNKANKAMIYLKRALQHYESYKKKVKEGADKEEPFSVEGVFGVPSQQGDTSGMKYLEAMQADTFYYLCQVNGLLERYLDAAVCCCVAFKKHREVGENIFWVPGYWADKSLDAVEKKDFDLGKTRLCLAAGAYVLDQFEGFVKAESKKLGKYELERLHLDHLFEDINTARAKIANYWTDYAYELMLRSKNHVEALRKGVESSSTKSIASTTSGVSASPNSQLYADELGPGVTIESFQTGIASIAERITDQYLLDFAAAKDVFLKILHWSGQAKSHFTAQHHLRHFVAINLRVSNAYKLLSYYEKDAARQAKMHKRRIDILEDTYKHLSPESHVNECRLIDIDLGDAYSQILEIKLRGKEQDEEALRENAAKINRLAKSAVLNYTRFIETVTKAKDLPEQTLMKEILHAYCRLGMLYRTFVATSDLARLDNLRQSLKSCSFVMSFSERHPRVTDMLIYDEMQICQDLAKRLPEEIKEMQLKIAAAAAASSSTSEQ